MLFCLMIKLNNNPITSRMNTITIDRLERSSESTGKHVWSEWKPMDGASRRHIAKVSKESIKLSRRKQTKPNYDTHRRDQDEDLMPYPTYLNDSLNHITPDNVDEYEAPWMDYLDAVQTLFNL